MDREGRKTGRRKLTHETRETGRMGEKGWNGCRSSCRGTSLAVDFLMEAGTTMIAGETCDKRTALQSQTQRAAMNDAVRCDERCTALRHFIQTIPMRQEGPNNRTPQPPIGLQRPRLSHPSIPSEPCLLSPKNTCCAGSSGPTDRLSKGIQGTQKQDGASQEAER